jgi:molybdopterin/thiamine biosynthesis adenylyltransferase
MSILSEPITIVGAGAIGGWTTLALAKMGFANIRVFDFDKVDTVNMNCQFFRFKDIGKSKVDALRDLVEDFTGVKVQACNERYTGGAARGIVIAAVDSMAARKMIWESHVENPYATRCVIDPRMGAQAALLYVMDPKNPKDRADYPKTLYSDSAAEQERCTQKATCWTANILSGWVCKAVIDILINPEYLRTAQMDILRNEFIGFKKETKDVPLSKTA